MNEEERSGQFDKRGDWARWLVMLILVLVIVGPIIVFAVVGPLFYRSLFVPPEDPWGENVPGVGQKLAFVSLDPLTNAESSLQAADLQGKVVLMNFWGTWCPPCLAELPHIADIHEKYADRDDFKLLAVSCGAGMEEDILQLQQSTASLLANERIDMPTYADPGQETRAAVDRVAGLDAYPTTLVLDRGGVIRGVWRGYTPQAPGQMKTLINRLLAESPTGGS